MPEMLLGIGPSHVPAMARSRLDLPQPDWPMMSSDCPSLSSRLSSCVPAIAPLLGLLQTALLQQVHTLQRNLRHAWQCMHAAGTMRMWQVGAHGTARGETHLAQRPRPIRGHHGQRLQLQPCPVQRLPLDERPRLAQLLHGCAARRHTGSSTSAQDTAVLYHSSCTESAAGRLMGCVGGPADW